MKKTVIEKSFLFLKLCSSLCVIALVLAFLHLRGYRINLSDSLPHWIYKIHDASGKTILRGNYVVINYSLIEDNPAIKMGLERKYLSRFPMAKQIGAASGDFISLRDNRLYVNDIDFGLMTILSADSRGDPLFSFPTPVILRADQYWLISNPGRGFDSPYFGWIDRKCITHIAYPVF